MIENRCIYLQTVAAADFNGCSNTSLHVNWVLLLFLSVTFFSLFINEIVFYFEKMECDFFSSNKITNRMTFYVLPTQVYQF